MQYIALQQLKTADGTIEPGDLVPQAASWDRCWFATGHVAAYPDDMVEEVRARMGTGILQIHGQEFGQDRLGLSLSPTAQVPSDVLASPSKVEAPPALAEDAGEGAAPAPPAVLSPPAAEAPVFKEPITADAGPAPASTEPPTISTGEAAEALGDAQDDAQADAAEDPSKPQSDTPRPRRGRRGRG